MKKSFTTPFLLLLVLFFSFASCTSDPTASNTGSENNNEETQATEDDVVVDTTPSLSPPDCIVKGQVLEGNTLWIPEMDMLAVIKADESTTEDEIPSHRIFELLDGRSCDVKFTETLPENVSPDFPYYLANIQYNKGSHLLGIQGYYDIYICDLDNNNKLSKLKPEFYNERMYDDPQSGMVRRIEVWEDYLLGYAQDVGAFVFDLSDEDNPKAIIPFAEWQNMDDAKFHSLFLLPTEKGYQGIMPIYNVDEGKFILNPIFETAQNISLNLPKNVRNNKQLVLRNADNADKAYAIDLEKRKLVNLPQDIATKKTQEIIKWMKTQ